MRYTDSINICGMDDMWRKRLKKARNKITLKIIHIVLTNDNTHCIIPPYQSRVSGMRTHFIDPDHRRNADINSSCCRCKRSLKQNEGYAVWLSVDGFGCVVHRDDATEDNGILARIGGDCANQIKLPASFILE